LAAAARFWSATLGCPVAEEPDATSNFIQLATPSGDVRVVIQRVQHEPRAHLDIETDSLAAEVAPFEQLGATVVSRKEASVVMQAPTGHRFLGRQPVPRRLRPGCEHLVMMRCAYP
jgi:hypothetical protein